MFGNLFKRKQELIAPYDYTDDLRLEWSPDSEGWIAPIAEFGDDVSIYIGSMCGSGHPLDSSCETALKAKQDLIKLHSEAIAFLAKNNGEFVLQSWKHSLAHDSWRLTGIEIFEHEKTPDEFALTFEPSFDQGGIWRVRFKNWQPFEWNFDD